MLGDPPLEGIPIWILEPAGQHIDDLINWANADVSAIFVLPASGKQLGSWILAGNICII